MPIPIILDCDPGHDDAIAILLALASPELELLGVTTVAGNTTLPNATRNGLAVLELAGAGHIPLAAGAAGPLSRELVTAAHVHGESGLDGPVLVDPTLEAVDGHAIDLIESLVMAHGQPVTLVPTGPLTNIAMLIQHRPHVLERVDRIVLMGGAIGLGNITPAAEFNIYVDPEAAVAVFSCGLPVTMVGLDVTNRCLLRPADRDRLSLAGPVGAFVADLLEFFFRHFERTYGQTAAPIHDAAAVLQAIGTDLIEVIETNVVVEAQSDLNRGRTVVDVLGVTGRPANAQVAVDVDAEGFRRLLVERLSGLGR